MYNKKPAVPYGWAFVFVGTTDSFD